MLLETLRISWREISSNLMRSLLTVLGIVIGIAAVVAILEISEGMRARLTKNLEQVGANLVTLRPGQVRKDGATDAARPFTLQDVVALRRDVTDVIEVTPVLSVGVTAVSGIANTRTTLYGTDNSYLHSRNRKLVAGQQFSEADMALGRPVCMIGDTVRRKLFGDADPLDSSLRMGDISCEVIAILDSHGEGISEGEDDDLILAPIKAVQNRLTGRRDVGLVFMTASSQLRVSDAIEEIRTVMHERRHRSDNTDDFLVQDFRQVRDQFNRVVMMISVVLGVIAGISLVVGGIGVMNIMLVSVTERTKEIGTRLAIGAAHRDILLQFLVEAVMLSAIGGVIGTSIGIGLSKIVTSAIKMPFIFDARGILWALVFSTVVGIVFGIVPARRASRLSPAEAMRYE